MRIGYFINFSWNPVRSGGGIHAYQLAKELRKRGHTICRMYPDLPGDEIVKRFRQNEWFRFLKGIDVIYIRVHELLQTDRFTLLKFLKLSGLPVIWEINAPLDENLSLGMSAAQVKRLEFWRAFFARFVDAAIATCDELKEYAQKKLCIRDSRSVPLGSDPLMFTPQKKNGNVYRGYRNKFKVVWVGSAQYTWQGLNDIFRVARILEKKDPAVEIFVIGKKENQTLDNQGLNNVHIIDRMPYEDIPAHIASADLGLCLYNLDGQSNGFYRSPLKLFDYMACSLPVIATRIGQVAKIIEHGRNGYLIDPGNPEMIAEHILEIKENRAKAARMGENARLDILRYYNWKRVADDTDELLKKLVRRKYAGTH